MRGLSVLPGACAILLVAALPDAARACSYAPPGLGHVRSPLPANGSTGQPRNARIWVGYALSTFGAPAPPPPLGPDLVLRAKDGAPVATSFRLTVGRPSNPYTYVVLTPAQPLQANTTYELVDRRTVPCSALEPGGCALGESKVFSSFTTGDFLDTTPPRFAGVADVAPKPFDTCGNSACCGRTSRDFTT